MCEREELVEFVAHEHNDVCKQNKHGKILGVENKS